MSDIKSSNMRQILSRGHFIKVSSSIEIVNHLKNFQFYRSEVTFDANCRMAGEGTSKIYSHGDSKREMTISSLTDDTFGDAKG